MRSGDSATTRRWSDVSDKLSALALWGTIRCLRQLHHAAPVVRMCCRAGEETAWKWRRYGGAQRAPSGSWRVKGGGSGSGRVLPLVAMTGHASCKAVSLHPALSVHTEIAFATRTRARATSTATLARAACTARSHRNVTSYGPGSCINTADRIRCSLSGRLLRQSRAARLPFWRQSGGWSAAQGAQSCGCS
jgi:hypothetical protein